MHTSRIETRTPAAVQVHYTVKTTSIQSPTMPPNNSQSVHAPVAQSFFMPSLGRSSQASSPMASVPYASMGMPSCSKPSPAKVAEPRSPSPNYFGLVVEPATDPHDSASLPVQNWSTPSSSIKSFAAALPMPIPLDANPDFEAFKRQIDIRSKGFGLPTQSSIVAAGGSREYTSSPSTGPQRPKMGGRWATYVNSNINIKQCDTVHEPSAPSRTLSDVWEGKPRMELHSIQEPPSMEGGVGDGGFFRAVSSSKPPDPAPVAAAPPTPSFTLKMPPTLGRVRRTERTEGADKRTEPSRTEDRDPRLSVMGNRLEMPSPPSGSKLQTRSETVPARPNDAAASPIMLAPAQLRALLQDGPIDQVLLLDIRAAGAFGESHILNALNLCVPTTLLKRVSYNLEKLQGNFKNSVDRDRFVNWSQFSYLVVYDCRSNELKEAVNPSNMIKKFTNEGYTGQACILRGGFDTFRAAYPDLIELPEECPVGGDDGSAKIAPVIGGVVLPASITKSAANPFFSNIRQNMDLADGVGQLDISQPDGLEPSVLPRWLQTAVALPDHGKQVADKFLRIEREEQMRMQRIYASFGGAMATVNPGVQISGIEQGTKNRYKDILPFEHTRVRLQSRQSGVCDYVNASHIRASRSNKRYIATQGPLPATFDDFWSVVWDNDVRVIVMLTAESEGGQLKCHAYWKSKDYGVIRIKLLSEKKVSLDVDRHRSDSTASQPEPFGRRRANTTTSLDATEPATEPANHYVIVRKFAVSHSAHPFAPMREVTHLHYPSWPDFGAPARPSHLLALVELTNVTARMAGSVDVPSASTSSSSLVAVGQPGWSDEPERDARARPLLVHCSAGCGRTGTFCAVDSVIDMLKRQRTDNKDIKDSQGDVIMGGATFASPISTTAPTNFFTSPSSVVATRRASNSSVGSPAAPLLSSLMSDPSAPLDTSWLGDSSLDLIQQTVEDLRRQRISMVQSLRQFVLCYETVTEWAWRSRERVTQGPGGLVRSATMDVVGRGRGRSGSFGRS